MKELYVVNCCRTAVGFFGGSLKNTSAVDMGALVVKEALKRANVAPEILESLREQTPIERLGTPEDIAQAMAFLVDAPFITGQVLGVNGGFVIT